MNPRESEFRDTPAAAISAPSVSQAAAGTEADHTVPVNELRLMLIGDRRVGKTILMRAFNEYDHRAHHCPEDERTVGIDMSMLLFESQGSPTIKCQVCDGAGQTLYYFSQTMHFTRRCLYVLVWTSHKFSESGTVQELTLDDIVTPMKQWLQLLAVNVPEASVLLVGTHCRVQHETFDAKRALVEQQVQAEMQRLRIVAGAESAATRQALQRQQTRAHTLLDHITYELSFSQRQLPAPRLQLADIEAFHQRLNESRPLPKRGVMQKAKLLLQTVQELSRTQERLCRLHAVYDGSVPETNAPLAHLKLLNDRSFAVDSIEGDGIAELLRAIEATCRDTKVLPFMGERVPLSWMQVIVALEHVQVQEFIGNRIMSIEEAVAQVRAALQMQLDVDVTYARRLDERGVQSSLEFWSLLGRVFVHDGHFLRDPRLVVDLLKPLMHPCLDKDWFRQEYLENAEDFSSDELLMQLHHGAVLEHCLLPHLAAWASSSSAAHASMLKFFESAFMISTIRASISNETVASAEPHQSLVTARCRQRELGAFADDVVASGIFHVVYALPVPHVGNIAHIMATVQTLHPSKKQLTVSFARDHVCIQRGPFRCAVSMRPVSDVFASKLGSIQTKLSSCFSHALVVSSNDDGLFAFTARCVDAMMQSGSFGSYYQCWLPYVSAASDENKTQQMVEWVKLSSTENPKSLSEVLLANASDVVIPSHNMRLREVLPRRPHIYMMNTFSGDSTNECCQRIKDWLQERLLCTVSFDRAEMGWTDAFVDEMKRGMANASAFVICLSPLYLTRPNCLRQLMWAMDMCAADKTKKLCVLPMHPCVSFDGCRAILDLAAVGSAAQVILPVDDRSKQAPTRLLELKAHKLSDVAISLLQRLVGPENVGINAEWLKLQPWRSDAEGENWEETSQPWAGPCEGTCVELKQLMEGLCTDVQAAVVSACPVQSLSSFTDVEDHLLRSQPPSQDYLTPSDTALLRSAFPQLLLNFTEAEAVHLMLLGFRDSDAVGCITHGFRRISWSSSQHNPVKAVFRMAADMSACFLSPRTLVFASPQPQLSAIHRPSFAARDHAQSSFVTIPRAEISFVPHSEEHPGGFGVVRQAMYNGRLVAVKVPLVVGPLGARDRKKFMEELEITYRLRHAACVTMFGAVIDEQGIMLVMEWMEGGSLYSVLDNIGENPVLPRVRLSIARQIADGLQYLHTSRIIHRDIKSHNVLLTLDNEAKLCDFGLAKLRSLTRASISVVSRHVVGTYAYAAPEIHEGRDHSEASDVYSLGIVMWELMTCEVPFDGLDDIQLRAGLQSRERPNIPNPLPTGFHSDYAALMSRCWHQDPAQRPTAREVFAELMRIDPSTRVDGPVVLFPGDYSLPASCTMISLLGAAVPGNTVTQAVAAAAELHIQCPSVQTIMQACHMSALEAQSIFVYTASQGPFVCPTHGALFASYNRALRDAVADSVDAWGGYSFLLVNALLKLPSVASPCTVYRGLDCALSEVSHLYRKGGFVWFRSPTSTTVDKDITMATFGAGAAGGAGTFIELRVQNAKEIQAFSAVPSEQERLLAPNTCFKVLECLTASQISRLQGFAPLPPNVDLVVLEEVRQTSMRDVMVLACSHGDAGDSR